MFTPKIVAVLLLLVPGLILDSCFERKIEIPYFESLTPDELCGGVPNNCQPTTGRYSFVSGGKDYSGDPGSILGNSYTDNIFDELRTPCMAERVTSESVIETGSNTIIATLEESSTDDFVIGLSSDIKEVLGGDVSDVLDEANIDADSLLSRTILRNSSSGVDISYRRVYVNTDDDEVLADLQSCRGRIRSDQFVVVGISVVETSGQWTDDLIRDVVSDIDASLSSRLVSISARNRYESDKTRLLSGSFEPFQTLAYISFFSGTQ